ncbi:MAG: hydroxyacid dehydrogenase [Chthoniobacteraceae bacterium]
MLSNHRPHALFILDSEFLPLIYGLDERSELERLAHFYAPPQTRESIAKNPDLLAEAEVIFSGWGAPRLDETFLEKAPKLRAIFYAAGTINHITTDAFWQRNLTITSAYAANARPVAEYTLGMILVSLKNFWRYGPQAKRAQGWGTPARPLTGAFRTTVALIGCGMIARRVIELLKPFDLRCLVCDPFLSEAEADELGVKLCSLEEAFAQGEVVSLHAPDKPQTNGMITGAHFSLMKQEATFINTARGRLVRAAEMIAVLRARPDLTAILDVCDPEPPTVDSPLLMLPNVVLTPHIAGSVGPECQRMGRYMLDEFRRYLEGRPLQWEITRELAAKVA